MGGSSSYATALLQVLSQNTDPQQSTGVCPKTKAAEREEKRILFSLSVVAKGTQSASLCCDWIIILLLIRVVYVFSLDSFQRGRELRAIQQDINPMKAFQRGPREQAGGRDSRQIQGDATATESAGQSHMAPGQTGRKTITYSLMSHPLLLSTPPKPTLPPPSCPPLPPPASLLHSSMKSNNNRVEGDSEMDWNELR